MESGQDAGALTSPAQDAGDAAPASGAEDSAPASGAEDSAPASGAEDSAPASGAEDSAPASEDGGATSAEVGADHSTGAPVWVAAMAVLAALLIAGIVVAVGFLTDVRRADAQNSRRQAAVSAARNAVTDLTTADYQHPQQYLDKLRADATGKFLNLFTNSATGFKNMIVQGKVQTTGKIIDVGVQRVGTNTAQLSVLDDVTVRNSQTPNGDQRAYRLSVSMVSAGSRWLVSNVEFVQ